MQVVQCVYVCSFVYWGSGRLVVGRLVLQVAEGLLHVLVQLIEVGLDLGLAILDGVL